MKVVFLVEFLNQNNTPQFQRFSIISVRSKRRIGITPDDLDKAALAAIDKATAFLAEDCFPPKGSPERPSDLEIAESLSALGARIVQFQLFPY